MSNSYYLLSYKKTPLGIYNKLYYLFDYILELIRFPDKDISITKFEINIFEVNIGYPISTLIMKFNEHKKLFLEETNGKRVEMSQDTFNRFKKIQLHFKNKVKIDITPKKEKVITRILSKEEIDKMKSDREENIKEQQKTIHELNRLKYQTKTLTNWYSKFKTDLKLYNEFQNKLNDKENSEFIIPEMFQEKYDFFSKEENVEKSFTNYFTTFNENSDIEIDEIMKFEIEDDSDNEDSDSDADL